MLDISLYIYIYVYMWWHRRLGARRRCQVASWPHASFHDCKPSSVPKHIQIIQCDTIYYSMLYYTITYIYIYIYYRYTYIYIYIYI